MRKLCFFQKLFFVIIACLGLFACVSIEGLYVDPSFTEMAIRQNNIGVAGVVSTVRRLSSREQNNCASYLYAALNEKYPGLTIMPAGDAVRALGSSRYQLMMRYYQENGVVPTEDLSALQQHISRMRYVAYARIQEDQVSHSRDQEHESRGTDAIVFNTTLTLSIHLDVYDLQQKRVVWSGSVSNLWTQQNRYSVSSNRVYSHESLDREVVRDLANVVETQTVNQQHEYPSPPSFSAGVKGIFSELLTRFPSEHR